ncbi:NADH dehydrogenase [ubiquinone] 1 alpha subcomplex assembly factor 2-like [Haliotis cracherodii]|uniref:NADH dehydrogenase [ubiquinone] 1 alpha subcomplex assembly factor 2-like n=1 Tax=Haliotis cracherodii TaxID=6455 RepID=UPI0039E9CD46
MSRRGGIIATIIQNFRNSLSAPKLTTKLVGADRSGNKYFEKEDDKSHNLRGSRWVEPPDGDQWSVPDVPTEWNAWLRGRRKRPPTQEEIDRNYALMMRTIHRAKELEEKEEGGSSSKRVEGGASYTSDVAPDEDSSKKKFPVFPEYEITPGDLDKRREKK